MTLSQQRQSIFQRRKIRKNKYLVRITETSQKFVHIEAEDIEDAYEEAWDRWDNEDPQFILTADDFADVDFYVYDSDVE